MRTRISSSEGSTWYRRERYRRIEAFKAPSPRCGGYRWCESRSRAVVRVESSDGGGARSGSPILRSITSRPWPTASRYRFSNSSKRYGGSDRSLDAFILADQGVSPLKSIQQIRGVGPASKKSMYAVGEDAAQTGDSEPRLR